MSDLSNQDVYVDAVLLMRRHGGQAANVAKERARFYRKLGDKKSAGRWRLIRRAVHEIDRAEPRTGEPHH